MWWHCEDTKAVQNNKQRLRRKAAGRKEFPSHFPGMQIQYEAPAVFPGGFVKEFIPLEACFCLFSSRGKVAPVPWIMNEFSK